MGRVHGESRILVVSTFLKTTWEEWKSLANVNIEEYTAEMVGFSVVDCGIMGTPILLSQLDIDLPSRSFMERCRDQAWRKFIPDYPQKASPKEFSAAEVKITFGEKKLHDWVVCSAGDPQRDADSGRRLVA